MSNPKKISILVFYIMKPKHIILSLVFFVVSCKVTQQSVSGVYRSDYANSQILTINKDHTFLYTDFDYINWMVKHQNIDSCFFIAKGKWTLSENKLILNSFDNTYSDTCRVTSIYKISTKLKTSNFSFKDISGNVIPFDRVDDEKGNFAFIFDKHYSNYDIDLSKHKVLTFDFYTYKPWIFEITDKTPTNYVVTFAPYYKQAYFNNKVFKIERNKIIDKKLKFKRNRSIK